MLFHLFYNVFFFPQQGIVLRNVKEEIFSKSSAVIGWLGPNQMVSGGGGEAVICHAGAPALDKEVLCNASLPNI